MRNTLFETLAHAAWVAAILFGGLYLGGCTRATYPAWAVGAGYEVRLHGGHFDVGVDVPGHCWIVQHEIHCEER